MSKNITARQVLDLVKQQHYTCALSGKKLTPETASLDHIVPLANGGKHELTNIWVVDHKINIAKGTLSCEEFFSMCREVTEYQQKKSKSDQIVTHIDIKTYCDTGPPEKLLF